MSEQSGAEKRIMAGWATHHSWTQSLFRGWNPLFRYLKASSAHFESFPFPSEQEKQSFLVKFEGVETFV